jgi:hypothetical protein
LSENVRGHGPHLGNRNGHGRCLGWCLGAWGAKNLLGRTKRA